MKNKCLALLLCLMLCVSVVTGCNLFTRNDERYYEAVVCTITFTDGQKDKITKRELLMGYNSYGYNYEQNYGQERKQAIDSTLDTIVDQHITVKAVEEYYKNANDVLFNDNETTYLWDRTYAALYENLKDYYDEVVGNKESTQEDEEEAAEASLYKPYEKKVYLVEENGKYVLKTYQTASTTRATYKVRTLADGQALNFEKDASKEFLYNSIKDLTIGADKEAKAWKSALNKYISTVKENYTYKKFKTDKDWLLFEANRVYEILRNNYIVEKYSVIYNTALHQDANTARVTVDNVLKHYSSKVRVDYETYKNARATFDSKILTDVANINYIYEGESESHFFYYNYIKMQFTDEQKKQYDSLQGDGVWAPTQKTELQKLYDSVQATVRDKETGKATDKKIAANSLLAEIQQKLQPLTPDVSDFEQQRVEILRDYLYLYNDDDTLKNAEYNAVAGIASNGDVLVGSTFTDNADAKDALKELYNNGNAHVGDISGLVKAEDGYYIFVYAGQPRNLFGVGSNFDISNKPENITVLSSTLLNVFSNKTLLDKIYDELTTDNFSVFQNLDIKNLRTSLVVEDGIVITENNIKDLYK